MDRGGPPHERLRRWTADGTWQRILDKRDVVVGWRPFRASIDSEAVIGNEIPDAEVAGLAYFAPTPIESPLVPIVASDDVYAIPSRTYL